MKFTTSITNIQNEQESIRGKNLDELIQNATFSETIFLLLRGREANKQEKQMMDALLVAAIDHGPGTASGQVSRIVASTKSSLHVSVAAGMLAMGERHGSAIEPAAEFFYANKNCSDALALAKELKEKKIRVAGFGHPFLTADHRSEMLFKKAKEFNIFGNHCTFGLEFHSALNKISSKKLPINIDGAMAAILLDMGFETSLMKGFFLISRVPGLVAQSHEELTNDVGIRRLDQKDIEFIG